MSPSLESFLGYYMQHMSPQFVFTKYIYTLYNITNICNIIIHMFVYCLPCPPKSSSWELGLCLSCSPLFLQCLGQNLIELSWTSDTYWILIKGMITFLLSFRIKLCVLGKLHKVSVVVFPFIKKDNNYLTVSYKHYIKLSEVMWTVVLVL